MAETPSAAVYFAGEHAYKLKKAVNLGFLDFTSLEARAAACARETELNRRFAPDVYLGVADVRDPDGKICDYLVVMRRMPVARRLSLLVRAAARVDGPVRQVARILAAAHARAHRSAQISAEAGTDALQGRWLDNISQTAAIAGRLLDAGVFAEIDGLVRQFLAGRGPLLQERIDAGRIVDGHGDLLADDIYCLDDGPRILDCLDFDDRLRWLDGLDDAACLVMDLERLGAPDLGRRFAGWYGEFAGDLPPASLLHHYVAYRAFVRAKIACIKASDGAIEAGRDARQLADLMLRHLRAGIVTLVLVGGPPGTGKTTLADDAGARLGWAVLSSDRIRKELAGLPVDADGRSAFGTGIYTSEWTARTYDELLHRAGELLARGESAVLDASWSSAELRSAAAELARATHAHLVELRCAAVPEVADRRLRTRPRGLSDAGPEIGARLAAAAAPWPGAIVIDTGGLAPGAAAELALSAIRPHGAEHVWRPTRPLMAAD
ncbi:MAG TPA: AAA family ATPase [Streptosporangiaceae bacterium]|nr:AAA family ATPase [Streptosporangiaceae bacterium]